MWRPKTCLLALLRNSVAGTQSPSDEWSTRVASCRRFSSRGVRALCLRSLSSDQASDDRGTMGSALQAALVVRPDCLR